MGGVLVWSKSYVRIRSNELIVIEGWGYNLVECLFSINISFEFYF